METDLKQISKIAKSKEKENWEFRSFLKGYDIELVELDAIVHEIYRKVESKIDCTKCGNCCKTVGPILIQKDIKKLSETMGMPTNKFISEYLEKDEEDGLIFKKLPCPLLKGNLCTQYDSRPRDCRSFPHLNKEEFVFRLIQVIQNYSICPIVFNVYEQLKIKLADDYDDSFFDYY